MIVNMIVDNIRMLYREIQQGNEDVRVAIEQSKKDIDKEIELRNRSSLISFKNRQQHLSAVKSRTRCLRRLLE